MKVASGAERAALCADVLEQALLGLRDLPALGSWGEVFGAVQEAIAVLSAPREAGEPSRLFPPESDPVIPSLPRRAGRGFYAPGFLIHGIRIGN